METQTGRVLIDSIEYIHDGRGFISEIGGMQNVALHKDISNYHTENSKCVTSGHLYVFNYNKDTFKECNVLTYQQYVDNGGF